MPQGCKNWWTKSRHLLNRKTTVSSIPALRDPTNTWVLEAKYKADLFVSTFSSKYKMADAEENDYTEIEGSGFGSQKRPAAVTVHDAEKVLAALREESGTGPDLLPSRILKYCAKELALPVQRLTLRILETGLWPTLWLVHWIAPLHKKKSIFSPSNYRGIHLTAQLSKVVERLIKATFVPFISRIDAFGPNQFAYSVGRGARDALAKLLLTWIKALGAGWKIAIYCSDVSGAFDRVSVARLVSKFKAKGLHGSITAVLEFWLRQRSARIVVGGDQSDEMTFANMVFQGTVLGPTLWNLFFEDARKAINECFFLWRSSLRTT
jgi:hypothetical protein